MEYLDKLISIGSNCRVRYQIDNYMTKLYPDYIQQSFFFDWLMNGGLTGVIDILNRDFVMNKDDIKISEISGNFIPSHKSSKFVFLHDFGARNKAFENYKDAKAALDSAINDSLTKYKYLGEKTKDILGSNLSVGLVYFGSSSNDDFKNIHSTLKLKYGKQFQIINILDKNNKPTATDGTVLNLFVDDSFGPQVGTNEEWQGCDESWNQAFSKIKLH
jgi:hypothetical protein